MHTLGDRLKYIRRERGYTQDTLAEKIGVSRGVIFNLEKNITEPQTVVINALAQSLRINKEWLLTGKGQMEIDVKSLTSGKALMEIHDIVKDFSENEQLYVLDVVKALQNRIVEQDDDK